MRSNGAQASLIVEVARLYYEERRTQLEIANMRRIAIADGDAFGKIEGIVEASLARSGAFNG